MRFEELNWMDVEKYLEQDDRLILIIGATEQHGYLSLLTDIRIPQALADAASTQTDVLVAPSLNFGFSPYFRSYPGTFSLRSETLAAAVEDIVRAAYGQGFHRLLILNGHGDNGSAANRLSEVMDELPGLQLQWYEWWNSHSVQAIAIQHELQPNHANWVEAFPFTIVGDMPPGNKVPPHVPSPIMDSKQTRQVYGDGCFGGPYQVESAIMDEIFAAALADVLELLKFE
jgi:creatinine amidohydrolase